MCRDDGTSWQGVLCYYNRIAAVNLNGMNLTGEAIESAAAVYPFSLAVICHAKSIWHVGPPVCCSLQGHCRPALQI